MHLSEGWSNRSFFSCRDLEHLELTPVELGVQQQGLQLELTSVPPELPLDMVPAPAPTRSLQFLSPTFISHPSQAGGKVSSGHPSP